jgi:hypothetical protein
MKKLILAFLFLILTTYASDAWAMHHGMKGMHPYGGYCRGMKWGWYGERKTVRSVEEVRALLEEFLKDTDLLVGEIRDRDTYYEADLLDAEGIVADEVIVDKRTCRIRSKY